MVDEPEDDTNLNERLLDVLVYAPIGLVLTAVEEFPRMAERGRNRLGVRVSSARAMGHLVVVAGGKELHRRSNGVLRRPGRAPAAPPAPDPTPGPGLHSVSTEPATTAPPHVTNGSTVPPPGTPSPGPRVSSHVPDASDLAIPAYDTLSASQVVQRLDGLSRGQLVAARAYEDGTRGRRTILSRIDQLLDERA
jgi:hypothetical protein